MLVHEQLAGIKVLAYPDKPDGDIFLTPGAPGDQVPVLFGDVVEQDNYVILSCSKSCSKYVPKIVREREKKGK